MVPGCVVGLDGRSLGPSQPCSTATRHGFQLYLVRIDLANVHGIRIVYCIFIVELVRLHIRQASRFSVRLQASSASRYVTLVIEAAHDAALNTPSIASIRGPTNAMISVLRVLHRVEHVRSA